MFWNLLLPLAQANESESLGAGINVYWKLLITVGCVVAAYLAGRLISRSARLPDYGWKISLITFTLVTGVVIVVLGWPPKFGIDLDGGVNLVYEVDPTIVGTEGQNVDMEQLIAAVRLRVDPTGTKQILIRPYGQGNSVEIIVPRVSQAEVEELKRQIVDLGTLEFRITANERDDADAIMAARNLALNQKRVTLNGIEVARWVPVNRKPERVDSMNAPRFIRREVPDTADPDADPRLEVLVMLDPYNVDGGYLRRISDGRTPSGDLAVNFTFNAAGSDRFFDLTSEHEPDSDGFKRNLAIALSGELYTAPELNEAISNNGQISGGFDNKDEVNALIAILNAGSLPAALNKTPLREQQISPTLGLDTISRGQVAMAVSMSIVLVFVLIYYRVAGVVAFMALVTNLVLILAVMISINAAFTLPGLAGLVLTVGMAVDANVLIFERIREELGRGAALRMAIRNGFGRATTTIVDANLTTLITAVVLYAIGTDQIKGFAVTLILGILMSMYSAVFCSRVVFDLAERTRKLKQLKMMRLFTATDFNFLGKKMLCGTASVVLIVAGLGAVIMRGSGVLDIDFTGGSQAQILFAEDSRDGQLYDTAYVRTKIDEWNNNVDGAADGGNLQAYLDKQSPGLTQELERALLDRLTTEISNGYTAEEREELDNDDSKIKKAAQEKAQGRLADEFRNRLPDLASLADLSVSEVTYLDDEDHKPEFVVNTANKSLLAVETVLDRVFLGELETNELTFNRRADAGTNDDPVGAFNDPADVIPDNVGPGTGGTGDNATDAGTSGGDDGGNGDATGSGGDNSDGGLASLAAWPVMSAAVLTIQDPPQTGDQPPLTAPPTGNQGTGDAQSGDDQTPPETGATQDVGDGMNAPLTDPTATTVSADLNFTHKIGKNDVESLLAAVIPQVNVDVTGGEGTDFTENSTQAYHDWIVKFDGQSWADVESWLNQVQANVAKNPVFPATNNIGGQVAADTRNIGIAAMVASLFFIVVYIWIRFQKVSYGFAAVVALVHDVLITLGAIALSAYLVGIPTIDAFKINLEMLAAFLTLIGYSLNDTIVIFDRIRENKGKSPNLTESMVNTSVNQTLSRTILTSGTTLIVVAILYFFGGQGVHGFSFALFVGVIVGTYSSIFVASPVLLWLSKSSESGSQPSGRKGGKLQASEATS
ncbi:MAG: protein translocase subunit SecD [Pirellulales bacterium]|nr:protein translocase subunit SecD [Pirellulales bacterium]